MLQPATETAKDKPHFVPGLRVRVEVQRAIVTEYATKARLKFGQIREFSPQGAPNAPRECKVTVDGCTRPVLLRMPNPRPGGVLLVRGCVACKTVGATPCDSCAGRGDLPCTGSHPCPTCKGGREKGPRECPDCVSTGTVIGCNEKKAVTCRKCDGKTTLVCLICKGSGITTPQRNCTECGATGKREITCNNCRGTKVHTVDCRNCGAKGYREVECRRCNGTGRLRYEGCPNCSMTGKKRFDCDGCGRTGKRSFPCLTCQSRGKWTQSCFNCAGRGHFPAVPCIDCYGKGSVQCFNCNPVARGTRVCQVCRQTDLGTKQKYGPPLGRLPCPKCRKAKNLGCPACARQGWLLAHRIDCLS